MQHLFKVWENKIVPLMKGQYVLLCLDFDGTLAPIVEHPGLVQFNPEERRVLRDLSLTEGVKTAIVSGRSLKDLKEFIKVRELIYVGNHGLEFEGPGIHHVHPEALKAQHLLGNIFKELKAVMAGIPGIFVEDKTFSLSVHYRQAEEKVIQKAKDLFLKGIQRYLVPPQIRITEGKKVWEVRPGIAWNKGNIMLQLLEDIDAQGLRALPVYVGDDRTDEDAFKVLIDRGVGIRVTQDPEEPTEAAYFLKSPDEVIDFLKRLKSIKCSEVKSHDRPSAF